jgi:SSS family solute:Na+ symporter
MAHFTKRYTKSVADFLAAGRSAGRYLISISEGMAALGAVSIILQMEMFYSVGFASQWWNCITIPVGLIMMLTGFIVYRYRETRSMTIGQFFEIRYSRKFRIFAGFLAFLGGILTFGIFPAVGANFFVRYCGLPDHFGPVPALPVVMFILLAIATYFTFVGGQISVIVTDFLQGMFTNFVLLAILAVVLVTFSLPQVFETLAASPPGESMVNPFDLDKHEGFTVWFFIIFILMKLYNYRSRQDEQAYQCAATDAHEAKMAGVVSDFRWWAFWASIIFLPLCAYTLMHNEDYSEQASQVQQVLNTIENEQERHQMITPIAMTTFVPAGLLGAFAAAMFAAFVSTTNTQLHSWGSIFIQDIVLPFRKTPLAPERHLKWLRIAIIGVAFFALFWGSIFQQTQRLQLLLMVTGQIFLAGAGSVIIGGLYWKRGTTAAAWAAMIAGSVIPIVGLILEQVWATRYDKSFPIDYKWMSAIAIGGAILSYVIVSLLGRGEPFNMDRMLHRGEYALESHEGSSSKEKWRFSNLFGFTPQFTWGDKLIYGFTIFKNMLFFAVVIIVSPIALIYGLTNDQWAHCHYYMLLFSLIVGIISAVWLAIGGFRDLGRLFKRLRDAQRDNMDDGSVTEHQASDRHAIQKKT